MKSHLILTSTEGMTNRDWLSFRTRGLGASDVPAVLGFSEYESPMSKFDEKTSLNPKQKFQHFAMFMGKRAEDINAELWEYWDGSIEGMMANYDKGTKVRRCRRINSYVQNPKYKWLFVSLDRVINKHTWKGVEFGEGTLELKNLSSYEADKWEGGIPLKHLLQVQTQMAVCEFDYGELAVKLDDRNYTVYQFEKNREICEQIIDQTHDFWQRVEKAREIQTQIFVAKKDFNLRKVEDLEAQLQELEPEPTGDDCVSDFLSEKYKKALPISREGTPEELEWAKEHIKTKDALKKIEFRKNELENRLKVSMKNVEVLSFGKEGKVSWSNTVNGTRIFRNGIK